MDHGSASSMHQKTVIDGGSVLIPTPTSPPFSYDESWTPSIIGQMSFRKESDVILLHRRLQILNRQTIKALPRCLTDYISLIFSTKVDMKQYKLIY